MSPSIHPAPGPAQPAPPHDSDVPEKARRPVEPDAPLQELPGEEAPAEHRPGRD